MQSFSKTRAKASQQNKCVFGTLTGENFLGLGVKVSNNLTTYKMADNNFEKTEKMVVSWRWRFIKVCGCDFHLGIGSY